MAWVVFVLCALIGAGGVIGFIDPEPGQEGDRVASLVVGLVFLGGAGFAGWALWRRPRR